MSLITKNFMLHSELAEHLYNKYCADLPIIDYHCHLSPKVIHENKPFNSLTELWLSGDHYKWRLMRTNGIKEECITGDIDDRTKLREFARTIEYAFGNPVYHWCHLELKRFFDIDLNISAKNADTIYQITKPLIEKMTPHDYINKSKVEVLVTTDDPLDSLEYHAAIKKDKLDFKVLPASRPDKVLNIDALDFPDYIIKLLDVTDLLEISFDNLLASITKRLVFFHEQGSRLADHALASVDYRSVTIKEAADIFEKRMEGFTLTHTEVIMYQSFVMRHYCAFYAKNDWVCQLHIGAMRNLNTKMYEKLGSDSGYDAINDTNIATGLARLLDSLSYDNILPKMIIYTLNPKDFETAITIMQCFQSDIPGKIQFGSAWWFLDSIDGMTKQLKALASNGLLSKFIGMLTDSRSFLSYPRHEYFRRLLCNIVAEAVLQGEFTNDEEVLGKLVADIAYYNAKRYFGF